MLLRKAYVQVDDEHYVKYVKYQWAEIKQGILIFSIYVQDKECEYEQEVASFKEWLYWHEVVDDKWVYWYEVGDEK